MCSAGTCIHIFGINVFRVPSRICTLVGVVAVVGVGVFHGGGGGVDGSGGGPGDGGLGWQWPRWQPWSLELAENFLAMAWLSTQLRLSLSCYLMGAHGDYCRDPLLHVPLTNFIS